MGSQRLQHEHWLIQPSRHADTAQLINTVSMAQQRQLPGIKLVWRFCNTTKQKERIAIQEWQLLPGEPSMKLHWIPTCNFAVHLNANSIQCPFEIPRQQNYPVTAVYAALNSGSTVLNATPLLIGLFVVYKSTHHGIQHCSHFLLEWSSWKLSSSIQDCHQAPLSCW